MRTATTDGPDALYVIVSAETEWDNKKRPAKIAASSCTARGRPKRLTPITTKNTFDYFIAAEGVVKTTPSA